jgi:D-inositol-3-phosphate glycosyltransferase
VGGELVNPLYVVHVARLMPIKHQATLIRALAAVPDAHAIIVGDVPAGQEIYAVYADGLKALARELGMAERVTFTGGLLAPDVRDWYRKAVVAVNLSPQGLFDKAALESMACGVPTIVSSTTFDSLLGGDALQLRLDTPDDVDGLAVRLRALRALSPDERARISLAVRERVIAAHSLERLMPRLVRLFETGEPE